MLKKPNHSAFTLIELIVVIAILGILVVELTPTLRDSLDRARSIACGSNLRQIGVALNSYLTDNNNTFPVIESGAGTYQYYSGVSNGAQTLAQTFAPYIGTNSAVLHCPEDTAMDHPPYYSGSNYYGSSYQWLPTMDDETNTDPVVFGRRGPRVARLSHLRLMMDWQNIHFGRCNGLYADGHVLTYTR